MAPLFMGLIPALSLLLAAAAPMPGSAWSRHNDAGVLAFEQSRFDVAEKELRTALDLADEFGPKDARLVLTLNNLADVYLAQAKYTQAEPLYLRAIDEGERRLGAMHPDLPQTMNNLATLYHDQHNYPKAEELYKRSLRLQRDIHGKEHPGLVLGLVNLGTLYRDQGRLVDAERAFRLALLLRERETPNQDTVEVIAVAQQLAEIYRLKGDLAKAEPLFQRSLRFKEQQVGPLHPSLIPTLTELANIACARESYELADQMLVRLTDIRRRDPELDGQRLAEAYELHGNVLRRLKRAPESEWCYLEALKLRREDPKTTPADLALCLHDLAALYCELSRYSEAQPLVQEAATLHNNSLPADHPQRASLQQMIVYLSKKTNFAGRAQRATDSTASAAADSTIARFDAKKIESVPTSNNTASDNGIVAVNAPPAPAAMESAIPATPVAPILPASSATDSAASAGAGNEAAPSKSMESTELPASTASTESTDSPEPERAMTAVSDEPAAPATPVAVVATEQKKESVSAPKVATQTVPAAPAKRETALPATVQNIETVETVDAVDTADTADTAENRETKLQFEYENGKPRMAEMPPAIVETAPASSRRVMETSRPLAGDPVPARTVAAPKPARSEDKWETDQVESVESAESTPSVAVADKMSPEMPNAQAQAAEETSLVAVTHHKEKGTLSAPGVPKEVVERIAFDQTADQWSAESSESSRRDNGVSLPATSIAQNWDFEVWRRPREGEVGVMHTSFKMKDGGGSAYFGAESALAADGKKDDPTHWNQLVTSMTDVAEYYARMGETMQAEPLFLKALRIREQWLGDDDAAMAKSLDRLATLYALQGNLDKQCQMLERALSARVRQYGNDHPEIAHASTELGLVALERKDYKSAERYLEQALAIRKEAFGELHPEVAAALANLGTLSHHLGDLRGAENRYWDAISIWEESVGPESPHLANCLNNLAGLHVATQRYDDAQPLLERAIEVGSRVMPEDDPDLARIFANYGLLLHRLQRHAEAVKYEGMAEAIRARNALVPTAETRSSSTSGDLFEAADPDDILGR